MNLEDVIQRGTRAAQPAATAVPVGTLYYVTDETLIERSSGSAWQSYSAAGSGITQLTGDVTAGPGSGSQAATIANDAVSNAKLRNSGALSVIGRSANSAGDPADISAVAASDAVLRESGSVLGFGTIATAGIANDAVTYAKIQNVSAASRLLGRGSAAGAGDTEEISLGSGLSMSGTTLSASGGQTVVRDVVGQLDIVNVATEQTLYSFSVTAGLLGTVNQLRLKLAGDYLNNSGATRTFTLRIKYGATTLYDSASQSISADADRYPWDMEIILGNTGATNAQFVNAKFNLGNPAAATAGLGPLSSGSTITERSLCGSAAEDSTGTLTFTVTIQHSTNNANLSFRRQFASLELMAA